MVLIKKTAQPENSIPSTWYGDMKESLLRKVSRVLNHHLGALLFEGP